jgi:hypothetical protein
MNPDGARGPNSARDQVAESYGWGLQSAWLHKTLSRPEDEIVVTGIKESREQKSDKRDAYGLAEKLRAAKPDKIVFKAPRQFTRPRELSRIHMTLVGDVLRRMRQTSCVFSTSDSVGYVELARRIGSWHPNTADISNCAAPRPLFRRS